MSIGTQISDMTVEALPVGGFVPFIVTDVATGLSPLENYRVDLGTELLTRVSYIALAAPAGSSLVGFLQSGTGAVARDLQAAVRETVSITDFGAVPDSPNDATAAALAAVASLGPAGGFVEIPPGEYRMNVVVAQDNIVFRGKGGRGEFNDACIRPFSLLSPPITFGNDTTDYRYCGLENLHISGSNSDADAYHLAAKNAPQAVLLKGGTVNFTMFNCVLQGGIQTLALVPSMTNPVTVSKFIGCTIRNDIDDSASARSVYGIRRSTPDGGYLTSNKFIATKINGPDTGYAVEMDGTALGITSEWNDCYIDCAPDHGVLIKGGTALVCYNLQIDPGTTGAVILETDQAVSEIARFISGMMRHGGQKMKFSGGTTIDIPAEADIFSYKGRVAAGSFGLYGYFGSATAPYSESIYYDGRSGVFQWGGIPHAFLSTTQASSLSTAALQTDGGLAVKKDARFGGELYVYGGNAAAGLYITVSGGGGGGYIEALGTTQNIRLIPSDPSAAVLVYGYGINPGGSQALGGAGSPWQNIYSVNAVTVTSDERLKEWRGALAEQGDLADAYIRAGKRIMDEIGFFQWKTSVAEKGGVAARWHCGVRAQQVIRIFVEEGLEEDWGSGRPSFRNAMFAYDEWDDINEPETELVDTEDGPERRETGAIATRVEAGSRFMLRANELEKFLIAVNHARLSALEGA